MAACVATTSGAGLSDMHLGRLLQERGFINDHQLVDALRVQAAAGGRLGSILVRRGCLSDVQLDAALRTQDDLRRAGVVFDVAVVAAPAASDAAITLALTVTVPEAGSQGGLPHGGVAARQNILVPSAWLPCPIAAWTPGLEGCLALTALDGRMLEFGVELAIRASDDAIGLPPGRRRECPPGEPRGDGFDELTLRFPLSADSLRDAGAGRFAGCLAFRFGAIS